MTNKEKIIDILEANTHLGGEVVHESMFEDVANLILESLSVPAETVVMPTLTGELENDLQIIYQNGKPHGIRDRSGYLLFFPEKSRYDNQPERYKQEMYQQNLLAKYLLKQLSKCSA